MTAGYDFGQLYGQADMSTGIRIPPEVPYDAVCVRSEWGRTKDGSKGQWTVDTTITTGQYAGTKLSNTITISPVKTDGTENSKGIGIMFRHLHAFGVPVPPPLGTQGFWELGWREEQVAQFMVGKPVEILVKDDEYDGVTRSKIRDYRPPKPGAPLQPQVQQPQQAQNGYGQPNNGGAYGQQPGYLPQNGGATAPQPWQQAVQGGPGYPPQVQGAPAWAQPAQPGQGGYGEFTPQGQSVQPGYGAGAPQGYQQQLQETAHYPGQPAPQQQQGPYGQPNADWNPAAQQDGGGPWQMVPTIVPDWNPAAQGQPVQQMPPVGQSFQVQPGVTYQQVPPPGYGAPDTGAPGQGAPYQQGAPSPSDQGQPAMPPWAQQQPGPVNPGQAPQDPNAAPPPPWAQ